ncbi:unnamed protein product [Caenorhabditis bovis]|uniref:Replication stress response regulator SDE2 n=1 Tax=Caenorhabditis bovis TaxID=2654633 RepID=A0A8S1EAK8_9PELO|nr:unnamed protein product [Caenorhabditis bovis]
MSTGSSNFGIANYVEGRNGKNKVLVYMSRVHRSRVYTFQLSAKFKVPGLVSWKCSTCAKIKNEYTALGTRLDRKVPLILVDNDVIKEDPDRPLNAEHFCKGKPAVDAALQRSKIVFYSKKMQAVKGSKDPEKLFQQFSQEAIESGSELLVNMTKREEDDKERAELAEIFSDGDIILGNMQDVAYDIELRFLADLTDEVSVDMNSNKLNRNPEEVMNESNSSNNDHPCDSATAGFPDIGKLSIVEENDANVSFGTESGFNESMEERPLSFPDKPYYWMNDHKTIQFIRENFAPGSFYIMYNGKIIEDFEKFVENFWDQQLVKYSFHLRMKGGKGGFGSLLRSFRVNKSTNKLMMRDLNGRRLASVDEENKLRRYLERQARKEEEMKQKRKAKLERLTAPAPKHQFEDQEYLSRREEIIEKTEDACEAGFAYMKEIKKKRINSTNGQEAGDESEIEDVADLFHDRGGRKRKIDAPSIDDGEDLKKRRDYEEMSSDSEDDSENEPDAEELEAIRAYFKERDAKKPEEEGQSSSDSKVEVNESVKTEKTLDCASNVDDLPMIKEATKCEYAPINLDEFSSIDDLELLGLEHLKSALTERGLKCGGTLSERAARLFSVKGLTPHEYPKNILTPEMKKKIIEEEEASRNAAKKNKKKKANK